MSTGGFGCGAKCFTIVGEEMCFDMLFGYYSVPHDVCRSCVLESVVNVGWLCDVGTVLMSRNIQFGESGGVVGGFYHRADFSIDASTLFVTDGVCDDQGFLF